MAHRNQDKFCIEMLNKYYDYFNSTKVLDVGSLDINGNNRWLFRTGEHGKYIGLDLGEGKNVDVVCPIEYYVPNIEFDVVISTEMLEHAKNWDKALERMYELLRKGGLFILTCASTGRGEHGTHDSQPHASPHTLDHYENISIEIFSMVIKPEMFTTYYVHYDSVECDLQFFGIKK